MTKVISFSRYFFCFVLLLSSSCNAQSAASKSKIVTGADQTLMYLPLLKNKSVAIVANPTCTIATGTITITSATSGLIFSFDGGSYAAYPAGGYIVAAGTLR